MKTFLKIFFTILIYCFPFINYQSSIINCNAQNLVPNPSFEEYYECPYQWGMIFRSTGWNSFNSSPDYLNTCSFDCGIPYSGFGFQYPATGNAYSVICCGPPTDNGSELIGRKLSNPLVIGEKYFVSFKAVLSDNPSANCGLDKLGVLFSTIPYIVDSMILLNENPGYTYNLINNYAHIYSDQIIIDTANWTEISGSFVADSAYEYIIIGVFFDKYNVNIEKVDPSNYACVPVYAIDDIYVGLDTINSMNNELNQPKINIYPNPFNNYTSIFISDENNNESISFNLYNIIGQDITQSINIDKVKNSQFIIKRQNLLNGIYFLKIKINNKILVKKLILTN